MRSGRPSPLTSPGEVSTLYWFQPLPSEVCGVFVRKACPRMVRYTRNSPLLNRTRTSLRRSPLRSPKGTRVTVEGQPEAGMAPPKAPVPLPGR